MTDQSTNFIASNGEHRNPFYQGTFEDETTEQMERRLYWAAAAVEAERVVQNNKTAPQPTPDVSALVAIAREIVNLHAKRKVVLTVHVEALEDALADLHQSPTKCPGTGCTDQGCPAHYANDCPPMSEVAKLVEALSRCRHQASYSIGEIEALEIQLGRVRDIANEALAAHRKGGDK